MPPAKDSAGRLVIPITNLLSLYRTFQVGNPGLLNAVCDTRLQISVHRDDPAFDLAGHALSGAYMTLRAKCVGLAVDPFDLFPGQSAGRRHRS